MGREKKKWGPRYKGTKGVLFPRDFIYELQILIG
jgi:hypothetical protein